MLTKFFHNQVSLSLNLSYIHIVYWAFYAFFHEIKDLGNIYEYFV